MRRVKISSYQAPVQKLGDSQVALSPKFRLSATSPPPSSSSSPHPPSPPSGGGEWWSRGPSAPPPPLIPGLPDDVALNCLLRLPVESHPSCRSVCRRWRLLLADKECFFTRRRCVGLRDPWLFVLALDRHGCAGGRGRKRREGHQWLVLDLACLSWHTIPAMPRRRAAEELCPHGLGCVAVPRDGSLLVCGGGGTAAASSDVDRPLDLVLKYEMHRNRWTVVSRMLTPRSFFAIGTIDGRVYAAGGSGGGGGVLSDELSSAESLDPVEGTWRPAASMGAGMAAYDAAVVGGKLLVTEGCVWPFLSSPRGQVYDPGADRWEPMAAGLREGWTGRSAVVGGRHLFVVSEHEGMRVKAYDAGSDMWGTVEGSPVVPEGIRGPVSVSSSGRRIFVVGRGLHVAVGHVERTAADGFSIRWEHVDAPGGFCDLTPSHAEVLYG